MALRGNDPHLIPHLIVTFISLLISVSILRVGLARTFTRRSAITLIRSGSVLAMIWVYRLIPILRNVRRQPELKAHLYLALFYIVCGTAIMSLGLRFSRKLRAASLAVGAGARS